MSSSGLGPREYVVEPEHVPFTKRRNVRIGAGVLIVLAVGGGAFGIADAFTGTSSPAAPTTTTPSRPLPGGGFAAGGRGALRGTISKIGSNSFTLTTRTGTTDVVDVNAKTTYPSTTGASGTFGDLKVNQFVSVTVEPNETPYLAESVTIGAAGAGRGGFAGGAGRFGNDTFGTVNSVGTNSFVITVRSFSGGGGSTSSSTITVDVTSSTTYRSGTPATGTTSGSFSDIKSGDIVVVAGSKSGSVVTATTVAIIPANSFGGSGGGFGG